MPFTNLSPDPKVPTRGVAVLRSWKIRKRTRSIDAAPSSRIGRATAMLTSSRRPGAEMDAGKAVAVVQSRSPQRVESLPSVGASRPARPWSRFTRSGGSVAKRKRVLLSNNRQRTENNETRLVSDYSLWMSPGTQLGLSGSSSIHSCHGHSKIGISRW